MSAVVNPHPTLAERFHLLVPTFAAGPAPLYAHLARSAAERLRPSFRRNLFREALAQWEDEPPRRLLPLRLLAVVHRWVLAGELPSLAQHYPSVRGTRTPEGAWPKFQAAVIERADELPELLAPPLQHNEPSRSAALAAGFLAVARETDLPLRLLEVGTSAGLLLRADHYYHRLAWWFPTIFAMGPPLDGPAEVVERRGCDLFPIDPTVPENEVRLRSMVWADLVAHLHLLEDAIEVCRQVPATIEQADGAEWLEQQLAEPRAGVATVVFHSLMRASGPPASLERMAATLTRAGAAATSEAPLAHLRFEPPDGVFGSPPNPQSMVETRLRLWPDGTDQLLAVSDVNGRHIRWQW
jgi:hypothetical protein